MLARRRLENEGTLARSEQERAAVEAHEKYTTSIRHRLKSFFEL
jgi:hypothetical protein